MSDELVKRYDVYPAYHGVDVEECHVGEFVYYADHADRIEKLTAERDRLRGGIEYILYGYGLDGPDYRFPYGEEEPDWITDHLIAVMNGESHD